MGKKKVALVLEGGAMRGMFTAGILDVMMDEGIEFDGYIGVSAGIIFGVNYLSKQKGRVIRYNKEYMHDKRYIGLRHLFKEGNIISTEFAYHEVPEKLDPFDNEAYMASGKRFLTVATNVDTGKAEYFQVDDVKKQIDVLRASASMPFLSKFVELDGKYYLDGGIADPIPFEHMLEIGYEKVVVVVTRDINYRKEPMSKALINMRYRKKKAFSETLKNRHDIYNGELDRLKELEKEGTAFVIRPTKPVTIKRTETDPEELEKLYQEGIKDAQKYLPGLKTFLAG